jgi:signal transduction histidine kinase
LAHDLNNMMAAVAGAARLAVCDNLGTDQRREYAGAITEAAMRASSLTRQMMDLVGGREREDASFDVGDSVLKATRLLRLLAGPQIDVQIDAPAGPSMVLADAHQFNAALVNPVINARDAIELSGRICISVEVIERHGDQFVAVAVADSGRGIPADQLDLIFQPLFTTKGDRGTGLGLAQIVRFVRQAGGDLAVQSALGQGSTFQLCFPLAVPNPAPAWQHSKLGQELEVTPRHLD